jgi:hypothetical protein
LCPKVTTRITDILSGRLTAKAAKLAKPKPYSGFASFAPFAVDSDRRSDWEKQKSRPSR